MPRDQTGVATGMNTIVRTIGGAIGAEVAVTILAANVLPTATRRHGYTITFAVCAFVMVVGVLASLLVPGRRRQARPASIVAAARPAAGD